MKCMLKTVDFKLYQVLIFVCPGCVAMEGGGSGLHQLPVNTDLIKPSWDWDGDLEKPTLSPSILTGKGTKNICHSFLREGVFQFLSDCTHELAGKEVPMPDLFDWVVNEDENQ